MFIRLLVLFSLISIGDTCNAPGAAGDERGYQTTTSLSLLALPVATDETDSDDDSYVSTTVTVRPLLAAKQNHYLTVHLSGSNYLLPQPRGPPSFA